MKTKSSNDKNYVRKYYIWYTLILYISLFKFATFLPFFLCVAEKTPPRDKTNKSDNLTSRKLFNTTPRKSQLDKLQQDLNQGKRRSPRLKSEPDVELEKNGSPFLETIVEIERRKDQKRRMDVLDPVTETLTFKRRLKSPKLSPKRSPNAVLGLPVCDLGQDGPKFFNLGLMDFPSFSLGLTQTPVKDKEVEVVKENPIIEEKPSTKEKKGDVVKRSHVLEVPVEVEHVEVVVEVPIAEEPFFKKANNKRRRKKDPSDKLVPTRVQPRRNAKKRPKSDKKKKPKTEKDSEIEEMESTTQEGGDIVQEIAYIHEKGPIGVDFQTWIETAVRETNVKLPIYVFKSTEQYKDWSFISDSCLKMGIRHAVRKFHWQIENGSILIGVC